MTFKENILPVFRALMTMALLCFIILFFVTLYIACKTSPGISIDPDTGEEHLVMITGHTLIHFLLY